MWINVKELNEKFCTQPSMTKIVTLVHLMGTSNMRTQDHLKVEHKVPVTKDCLYGWKVIGWN